MGRSFHFKCMSIFKTVPNFFRYNVVGIYCMNENPKLRELSLEIMEIHAKAVREGIPTSSAATKFTQKKLERWRFTMG